MDDDTWRALGRALEVAGEVDRSAALRLCARWLTADPRAALALIRERLEAVDSKATP